MSVHPHGPTTGADDGFRAVDAGAQAPYSQTERPVRGAPSDNTTLISVLTSFEEQGFTAQLIPAENAAVQCGACSATSQGGYPGGLRTSTREDVPVNSSIDLTVRTQDRNQPVAPVPNADRARRASVWEGSALLVLIVVLVMAGCGGDADDPSVPTSPAPAASTAPSTPSGAGVPLEPGSNLPPVEGDDDTITTSTD